MIVIGSLHILANRDLMLVQVENWAARVTIGVSWSSFRPIFRFEQLSSPWVANWYQFQRTAWAAYHQGGYSYIANFTCKFTYYILFHTKGVVVQVGHRSARHHTGTVCMNAGQPIAITRLMLAQTILFGGRYIVYRIKCMPITLIILHRIGHGNDGCRLSHHGAVEAAVMINVHS